MNILPNHINRLCLIYLLFINFTSFAQSIEQSITYASELKLKGHYQEAIRLYNRILFFDTEDAVKSVCYHNLGDCFASINEYQSSVDYYDLTSKFEMKDSIITLLLKKKIYLLLMLENFDEVKTLLNKFPPNQFTRQELDRLVAFYYLKHRDYDELITKVNSSDSFTDKKKIIDLAKIKKKIDPQRIKKLSTIMPGLGQIYVGNTLNGINSFLLVTGIGAFTVQQMLGSAIPYDVLLTGVPFFVRYYKGGIYKSSQMAQKKGLETERELIKLIFLR